MHHWVRASVYNFKRGGQFVLQLLGPRMAALDTALDFFTACAVRIIQDSGFGSAPLGFTVVA